MRSWAAAGPGGSGTSSPPWSRRWAAVRGLRALESPARWRNPMAPAPGDARATSGGRRSSQGPVCNCFKITRFFFFLQKCHYTALATSFLGWREYDQFVFQLSAHFQAGYNRFIAAFLRSDGSSFFLWMNLPPCRQKTGEGRDGEEAIDGEGESQKSKADKRQQGLADKQKMSSILPCRGRTPRTWTAVQ